MGIILTNFLLLVNYNSKYCNIGYGETLTNQFFQPSLLTMQLTISTPALLFPAITLLLLAYTNRFLALATLIRGLHAKFKSDTTHSVLFGQIKNLRARLTMIRYMQAFGVLSFVFTVICMFLLFQEMTYWANIVFGVSLLSLLVSLIISLIEIQVSTKALSLELSDMEK